MKRSATDLVVIVMSIMVASVIVICVIGIFLLRFYRPEVDVKNAAAVIGDVVKTVVIALIGFVGGRAQGKMEANGARNT